LHEIVVFLTEYVYKIALHSAADGQWWWAVWLNVLSRTGSPRVGRRQSSRAM